MDGKSIWGKDTEDMAEYFTNLDQSKRLRVPHKIKRKFDVIEMKINNRPCYLVESKTGRRNDTVVFFLHGGGLVYEMDFFHWDAVAHIVDELSVPVFVAMYPVYPETNPDIIMKHILDAYRKLQMDFPYAEVTLLGDSIGADLSLSLCHYLIETNSELPLPDKIIGISPAMLFGIDDDTLKEMEKIEPEDVVFSMNIIKVLPVLLNLSPDTKEYFSRPLHGDFSKFPPLYVFSGTREIFYPQIPPFVKQVKEAGNYIEFYTGYKLMHDWPLMPFAPESKKAFSIILDIIAK
jgi:acetyl esterase/lipase